MTQQIRLSASARVALRTAITNHENWNAVRREQNLSLATMSRDDYFRAAGLLGIDVAEIARTAGEEIEHTREIRNDEAKDVFNDARGPTRAGGAIIASVATTDEMKAEGMSARERADATSSYREAMRTARNDTAGEAKTAYQGTNGHAKSNGHDDKAARLAALLSEFAGDRPVDAAQVKAIVKAELETALRENGSVTRVELTRNGVSVGEVKGHKHPKFGTLLKACTARAADGYTPNVWLSGPAGSGKTHAATAVAKALDLAFHYNGAIGMAHELLGFIDAGGTYHRTPFREAYENGGIYLFDEVDGSDNSALLALNAALANGCATFPDGPVLRHEDCKIIAAANTWGFGGTADYVGRAKIDAAFLSRFAVRLSWEYDTRLEQDICGNAEFARRVQKAREQARNVGLKVLITPRDSIAGAALIAAGFSQDEAADMTYRASLSDEQRLSIR